MQGFSPIWTWLRPRGVRLSYAAAAAADSEDFHGKQELCRRIRRLAMKDRKHRSAGVFERMLNDADLAVMVRLEAARALARWGLVLPAARRLLESADEIPSLKSALTVLIAGAERAPLRPSAKVPA
jgi:hypothetical protein